MHIDTNPRNLPLLQLKLKRIPSTVLLYFVSLHFHGLLFLSGTLHYKGLLFLSGTLSLIGLLIRDGTLAINGLLVSIGTLAPRDY